MLSDHHQSILKVIGEEMESISKLKMDGLSQECQEFTNEIGTLLDKALNEMVLDDSLDLKTSDKISNEFSEKSAEIANNFAVLKEKRLSKMREHHRLRRRERKEKLDQKQKEATNEVIIIFVKEYYVVFNVTSLCCVFTKYSLLSYFPLNRHKTYYTGAKMVLHNICNK